MTLRERRRLFKRLQRENPRPTTELRYSTPFELLVSVMLSAQSTDVRVNQATEGLFRVADSPRAVLRLGLRGLKRHIRSIGLYNTKAKNILETCRLLLRRHQGQVPSRREELEALPGVGRKTANVVLNTAFGQPTIAVDTHIFRVSNRTGLAPGSTPLRVEQELLRQVPAEFRQHTHHWLILHGRYVCRARAPLCGKCHIRDLCAWPHKRVGAERSPSAAAVG